MVTDRFRKPAPARACRFESCPLRQKGNCKCELPASPRSATNLYGISGEKEPLYLFVINHI